MKINFWNNLDTNQWKALLDLANDASIIIKPADKGGAIIIMNSNDYSEACLNSLLNTDFMRNYLMMPILSIKQKLMTKLIIYYQKN